MKLCIKLGRVFSNAQRFPSPVKQHPTTARYFHMCIPSTEGMSFWTITGTCPYMHTYVLYLELYYFCTKNQGNCTVFKFFDRDENLAWHGSFETGDGSFTGSCKSWTTNASNMTGLAGDFLYNHMLDQKRIPCNSSLIVFCIEISQNLARKHISNLLDLPEDSTKSVHLSDEEHKLVLEKYDNEWDELTKSDHNRHFH